jgi:hypothetical protein
MQVDVPAVQLSACCKIKGLVKANGEALVPPKILMLPV